MPSFIFTGGKILISILAFVLFLWLVTSDISHRATGITYYLFIMIFGYYSFGFSTTEKRDKYVGKADTNLPTWARRILFLYKPNPFGKKTIIYQSILVITAPIILLVSLLMPENIAALTLTSHVIIMPIIGISLDVSARSTTA